VIGIIIGVVAVVITFLLKGVSPAILINLPSIFIVIVGSSGAVIASFGMAEFKKVPKLIGIASKAGHHSGKAVRDQLVAFAERARREGLLALENDVNEVDDPFLKRGLQMVIDGLEPETVEEVLDLEVEAMKRRHSHGVNLFSMWAGYAPTFGILGAVMGLIAVMAHLSEPEKLGAGIQVAFIATLLAVGLANILFMPISVALRGADESEVTQRQMAMAGILAIQAGDNPRIVAQKLETFLSPAELAATAAEAGSRSAGGGSAGDQAA
jgi:chemotaxis protein MotA